MILYVIMKDSGLIVVILTSCGVKGDMSSKIPLPDSDNKLTSHCQFDVTINVLFFLWPIKLPVTTDNWNDSLIIIFSFKTCINTTQFQKLIKFYHMREYI